MLNNYKRVARTFEELEAGELLPLVDALPELVMPANPAPGVPASVPPEGVGQGAGQRITISGFLGRPQGEPYSSEHRGFPGNSDRHNGLRGAGTGGKSLGESRVRSAHDFVRGTASIRC